MCLILSIVFRENEPGRTHVAWLTPFDMIPPSSCLPLNRCPISCATVALLEHPNPKVTLGSRLKSAMTSV